MSVEKLNERLICVVNINNRKELILEIENLKLLEKKKKKMDGLNIF